MKFVLCIILFLPNLLFGNEQEARELYVKAKTDLMNNGCDFETLGTNLSLVMFDLEVKDDEKTLSLVNEIALCGQYYKENTLPIFDKIINEYPSSQVAYDLLKGDEYLSENLLNGLLSIMNNGIENLNKSEPLTASEIDTLSEQLYSCLSIPAGIRSTDLSKYQVVINIEVNADRTIKSSSIENIERTVNDKLFRTLAEASLRAVNNPDCSPLKLPENKYSQWKEINFTFDWSWMIS